MADLANPNAPEITISNLDPNLTYFFVITAYDSEWFESEFSNAVTYSPTQALVVVAEVGVRVGDVLSPMRVKSIKAHLSSSLS